MSFKQSYYKFFIMLMTATMKLIKNPIIEILAKIIIKFQESVSVAKILRIVKTVATARIKLNSS